MPPHPDSNRSSSFAADGGRLTRRSNRAILRTALCIALFGLGGCRTIIESTTRNLSQGMSQAILDNEDLEGVRDGAPAYLLLLDGLLVDNPGDADLLFTAARLNGAYGAAFVADAARQQLLADKALDYALRGACKRVPPSCEARTQPFDALAAWVARLDEGDLAAAYALAAAWAGSIQAHADDWDAIADLARVRALLERILALDEAYADGGPHVYVGVLDTLLPPAMGGKPEEGRKHFERAIELSGGRDLLAKVTYARQYARLVFDRELHDRLLTEVLAAEPRVPGLTLQNVVAREQARALLDSADAYF
jgi:hypothetical protein